MSDTVVRPTQKWVRFSYTVWFIIGFVAVFVWNNYLKEQPLWPVGVVVAALWILWPLRMQIRRRFTKLILEGERLRFETGVFSRTTRTLQLAKIQDITVQQTFLQRLLDLGNVAIRTAAESEPLVIANLDQPQAIADQIMDAARDQQSKRKGERS